MGVQAIVESGRRLIATSLLDHARIQDRSMAADTTGGRKETFTERPKSVVCRFVQPKDDDPVLRLDSVWGPTTLVLLLPLGTVFAEGDRVRNLLDGNVYQITRNISMPSETAVIMRAGLREVE